MHGVPIRTEALGRERCATGDLPRHRHTHGYVTLVLSGRYFEAGDAGRYRAEAGVVLIHRPFEAHLDRFIEGAADVLNLPLIGRAPAAGAVRVDDPDEIARLAETDASVAAELVWHSAGPAEPEQDWPDMLADWLRRPNPGSIAEWAQQHRLSPASVSRGFARIFGTTPSRYRAEARTRLAVQMTLNGKSPLADLAAQLGFSDQAHMTRSVVSMTGMPPLRWSRRIKRIQDPPRLPA